MHIVASDWIMMGLFFAGLFFVAWLGSRKKSSAGNDFFTSGRSMPWWLIGVSMVAANTSTNSANLFTQIIREDGLAGNWVWWSFLTGGILIVFVYAKLWHRSGATTDIAFYELRYSGRPAAFLRGFRAVYLGVIYNLVVLATVLLGAAKIGTVIFGVSIWLVLGVIGVVSVAYSTIGGIRGTIYADFYLFAVIMAGAVVVMLYAVGDPAVGGFRALMNNPAIVSKLDFFPEMSDTNALMALFVVPVAIQWWNVWYSGSEPGGGGYIVQRMLTAKTPNHALGGTLFAQILNVAIRPWPWFIAGFASILIFPDLDSIRRAFPSVDPALVGNDMAYPALFRLVPAGWLGVVAASMAGAIFSTVAALVSMGSNYVANDVWKRFIRTEASDRELVAVARWSAIGLAAAGCLLAPLLEDAKSGFDMMVMVGAGTGAIFLLRWFWMRINAWTEIVALTVSIICAAFFQMILPHFADVMPPFWKCLLMTIAVTTVSWVCATFLTKPEPAEVISRFRSLVRADGRDVGKGLLYTFLVSVAIFASMYVLVLVLRSV